MRNRVATRIFLRRNGRIHLIAGFPLLRNGHPREWLGVKAEGNMVLITGGATGIGYALAEKFVDAGSEVIVCGRRRSKLQAAKRQLPAIQITRCDISIEAERKRLVKWATTHFPDLNVLVNNAGIQREMDFTSPTIWRPMSAKHDEITINLVSQIRLCALLTPRLLRSESAAIVNISSGLAFVPIAAMPIYCATKAALHSFTMSLRYQLRNTSVQVFEAVPPATDTELDASFAGAEEQVDRGISPREVADAIMEGFENGTKEILIGRARGLYEASSRDPHGIFQRLNG